MRRGKERMGKSDIIIGVIIFVVFFAGVFAILINGYNEFHETADLLEHCKDNGYDGIRYEQVNFFKEEPRCANFTIEEKFKMDRKLGERT